MAAHDTSGCHNVKEGPGGPRPSLGGKRPCREAEDVGAGFTEGANGSTSTLVSLSDDGCSGSAAGPPAAKKSKLHPFGKSSTGFKPDGAVAAQGQGDRPRLASPTDVRSELTGSQPKAHTSQGETGRACQVKTLPPTLRGIIDAARALQASNSSSSVGKENSGGTSCAPSSPLLVSFPTETAYMMACTVKTASSRSIRKMMSRSDSQTSSGSMSSFNDDLSLTSHHEPTLMANPSALKEFLHPPNASLEWMLECRGEAAAPHIFVCDKHHALRYCHFSRPKTFAIRPPSVNRSTSGTAPCTPMAPRGENACPTAAGETPQRGFSNLPETPLRTPKPTLASPAASAVSPITPNNHQKVCAASFSEGREAFLRIASKFWPGPVAIHVEARTLRAGDEALSSPRKSCSSTSVASLPSLPSMGDLTSAGSLAPSTNEGGVPVLPPAALIPASQLMGKHEGGQGSERYFVGITCPSHPLPRKILNEVYCGPAVPSGSQPPVSHSPSCDSLASMGDSSPLKGAASKKGRFRSGVAVVGCVVPGPTSSADADAKHPPPVSINVATSAADVGKAAAEKAAKLEKSGRLFVVDGEDNREIFSVPPCQHGPSPVSLVIDEENRIIRVLRNRHATEAKESTKGAAKETLVSRDTVYRALLTPASPRNGRSMSFTGGPPSPNAIHEIRGGSTNKVDRVITAVLSRWKVQE
ncbi:hypothetical protein ACHAXT_006390 [Thalassiosira profunda]